MRHRKSGFPLHLKHMVENVHSWFPKAMLSPGLSKCWPGWGLGPSWFGQSPHCCIYICSLDWTWIRSLTSSLLQTHQLSAIIFTNLDLSWIRSLTSSLLQTHYLSATVFTNLALPIFFLMVSDDVEWNASHSDPYFVAELSVAGIRVRMVGCKRGIQHPAWAQPPDQINLCMCKWPLCLERFSTAGPVLACNVKCKCATNVVPVQFNVPVFSGAIKQQTPEVSMRLPESVNGRWHCMWMHWIPYFNCKALCKFPIIIVYTGKHLYMQNLTTSGF